MNPYLNAASDVMDVVFWLTGMAAWLVGSGLLFCVILGVLVRWLRRKLLAFSDWLIPTQKLVNWDVEDDEPFEPVNRIKHLL